MESSTLLARYDEQLRADAEVDDADEVVRIGPVLAATFPARRRGFPCWSISTSASTCA